MAAKFYHILSYVALSNVKEQEVVRPDDLEGVGPDLSFRFLTTCLKTVCMHVLNE